MQDIEIYYSTRFPDFRSFHRMLHVLKEYCVSLRNIEHFAAVIGALGKEYCTVRL